MNYVKHFKKPFVIFILLFLSFLLWALSSSQCSQFQQFNNKHPSQQLLVPNTVHYIIFNRNTINFITYLSILSVLKVQKPNAVYIHSNGVNFLGYYWEKLRLFKCNTTIYPLFLQQPTHVYGQVLSSVYHSSDVARIHILQKYGGIYLDTDVMVIKSLDPLRHYEMVVGWPDDAYMGTQVLLAVKSAPFLEMWLRGYKKYHPRDWYYNAGIVPTEILQTYPYIAHYENTSLGVQNLLEKLHSNEKWNWGEFYSIHLLSRHSPSSRNITEINIPKMETNFGRIVQWILTM